MSQVCVLARLVPPQPYSGSPGCPPVTITLSFRLLLGCPLAGGRPLPVAIVQGIEPASKLDWVSRSRREKDCIACPPFLGRGSPAVRRGALAVLS